MADTFSTKQFIYATIAFADGTIPTDAALVVDNTSVATVTQSDPADPSGQAQLGAGKYGVVAQGAGTATLTATGGGKTVSQTITVTQADHGDLVLTLSDPLNKP